MDFSWANGHGPVDETSPFVNLPQQNRATNGKSESISNSDIECILFLTHIARTS
jgi:hypothetical protein